MPVFFMSMNIVIYVLATWRLASLLANEAGPFNILGRLRDLLGVKYDDVGLAYGTSVISKSIICVWCSSVWIAIGWMVAIKWVGGKNAAYVAIPFAISAGAIIVSEVLEWLGQARQRS